MKAKKKCPTFPSADVSFESPEDASYCFLVVQNKLRSLFTSIEKRQFLFSFYGIPDKSTLFSQARTTTGNFPYCRSLLLGALAEKGALFAELTSILWCRASWIAPLQTASQSLLHLNCPGSLASLLSNLAKGLCVKAKVYLQPTRASGGFSVIIYETMAKLFITWLHIIENFNLKGC